MGVNGATDIVTKFVTNAAPPDPASSKEKFKEVKEAVDHSTTSNDSSKQSQGTSNSYHLPLATRPPINLGNQIGQQVAPLQAGGSGGGGAPSGILGTAANMCTKMMLGGLVSDGLLDSAKEYGLKLTKAGADAIAKEISLWDVPKLKSKDTPAATKLKIVRQAAETAIKNASGDLRKELEKVVADADKLTTADGGTPR